MPDKYTISVEDIVEEIWNEDHPDETHSIFEPLPWRQALAKIDEHVEYACPIIFNFDFECWGDEEDRLNLEKHILHDYFTRNICCDSVTRWNLFLKNKLHDIMPRYKALYNAQMKLIAENPLSPYHIEETKHLTSNLDKVNDEKSKTSDKTTSQNISDSSSISNNKGIDDTDTNTVNKFSNTPQALASAVESGDEIPLNYLSTMQVNKEGVKNKYESINDTADSSKSKSNSNVDSDYESNNTGSESKEEEYVKEIKGNILKFNNGQLIKDYQNAILNIENMISEELADLFFMIY